MTGKDAIELRKRLKKDCSITRVAGCYVDSNKEQVVTFSEPFISVDELESLKYLEIAKKTLSGSIGNNILELDFETIEEQENGMQKLLYDIRESGLKDEALLQKLYTRIIDNYSYPDNYLMNVIKDYCADLGVSSVPGLDTVSFRKLVSRLARQYGSPRKQIARLTGADEETLLRFA